MQPLVRRALVAASLSAASALFMTSCTQPAELPANDTPGSVAGATQSQSWEPSECKDEGIRCKTYSDLPTVFLPRTSGKKNSSLAIFDAGGPGISVQQSMSAVEASGVRNATDVLIIGESWQVKPPSDECLLAEQERLENGGRTSSCDPSPWGFDRSQYQRALEMAEEAIGRRATTAIGVSFGATRLAAYTQHRSMNFLMVSPAPPPTNLSAVVNARAKAIENWIDKACIESPCNEAWTLGAKPADGSQEPLRLQYAMLGSLASPSARNKMLKVSTGTDASEEDEKKIRRAAYAATYRVGDGRVIPNLLAYRGQTCSFYSSDMSDSIRSDRREINTFSQAINRTLDCPEESQETKISTKDIKGCVFVAKEDLVTPARFAEAWLNGSNGLSRSRLSPPAHGQFDDRLVKQLTQAIVDRTC